MKARKDRFRHTPRFDAFEERIMLDSAIGFAAASAVPEMRSALVFTQSVAPVKAAGVLDQKVTPYDLTTRGTLTYNLSTGSYYADLEVAQGLTYDTEKIKELLQGNVSLPNINPIKAVAAFYGVKATHSSNHASLRDTYYKKHGAENVYFVSERFSEYAGPEKLGAELAKAIATAGSSSASSVKEAFNQIKLELSDVYAWAKNKSKNEVTKILGDVLEAIVTGRDVSNSYLAVKWFNVTHTYKANVGAYGVGTSASFDVPHLGFAVVWKTKKGSLSNALKNFEANGKGDTNVIKSVLTELLNSSRFASNATLTKFLKLATSNPADAIDKQLSNQLKSSIGLDLATLKRAYISGKPVVDLTKTSIGSGLKNLLGDLALGNEGSASINRLEFNLATMSFQIDVSIRHRHSWGSVGEILAAAGREVGKWATKAGRTAEQWFDSSGDLVRKYVSDSDKWISQRIDSAGKVFKEWIYYDKTGIKLNEFREWAGGKLTDYEKFTTSGWKEVNKYLNSSGKWVSQRLDSAGKLLKEWIYYDSAGNKLNEFREWAGGKLTDYEKWTTGGWKEINKYISTTGKWVSQRLNSAGDLVKEWIYFDDAGQQLSEFREWAGDQLTEYGKWTTSGWKETQKWLASNGKWISQRLNSVGDVVKEWVYYDAAGAKIQQYGTWANDKLTSLTKYTSQKVKTFEAYISTTGNWVEKSYKNGTATAVRVWNSTGKYLGDELKNFSDAAASWDPTTQDWWPF